MRRREFVLTMISGMLAATMIPLSAGETDEIILKISHKAALGAEIQRCGVDGKWHPLATIDGAIKQVIDRINPADRFQYRVRSLFVRGKSKWSYTSWS